MLQIKSSLDQIKTGANGAVNCAYHYTSQAYDTSCSLANSARNSTIALTEKMVEVAKNHLTPRQLLAKTRYFLCSKVKPSTPLPDWNRNMGVAQSNLGKISRELTRDRKKLISNCKKINDRKVNRHPSFDRLIEKFYKVTNEIHALKKESIKELIKSKNKLTNKNTKLSPKDRKISEREKIAEYKRRVIRAIIARQFPEVMPLLQQHSILEKRIYEIHPIRQAKAQQCIHHHDLEQGSTFFGRVASPVISTSMEMAVPGSGAIASAVVTTATMTAQLVSAKKLPVNSSSTVRVQQNVTNRALCALACTFFSITCLPTVRSVMWTALEAAANNSTRV